VSAGGPYSELVLRLFREAPRAGRAYGEGWASGAAAEPLTATRVQWYLRAGGGRIERVAYRVRGCPHTIAATAHAAAGLPGRAVAGLDLDLEGLVRDLGIPAGKRGRLFVIQDALQNALLQIAPGPP